MTTVEPNRAFYAFETQLRTLCLKEFPCGGGSWRETKTKNLKKLKTKDDVESKYSITLKDFGAEHEKTETLQEYVGSKLSPWNLDYSWSEEAKQLREIAVKSPWLIDDNFILSHFKTLRIVDKQVAEVDKELLKFRNLEELTLSANKLVTVNTKNLPLSLRVLELCANQISDLSALCVRPPLLIHLGLGMNKISFMGDYLTGDYWPNLLSLDLSHNNLSDLLDVIRKLGTLPKLRNLILQGNPLALIAGYRGYTIDSLRKLNILDDIMISADEKHHYKGLARRREYILDEAKVTLEVGYIKGVPMPDEIKNPDDQPEYPIVERKYLVQFMFLAETVSKPEVMHIPHDELEMPGLGGESPMPSGDQSTYSGMPNGTILKSKSKTKNGKKTSPAIAEMEEETDMSFTETAKNVNFTAEPEVVIAREPTTELEKLEEQDQSVCQSTPDPGQREGGGSPDKEQNKEEADDVIKESPLNSGMGPWSEDIQLNWSQVVIRDDLLGLRNFFKQGMNIMVMEEMVHCTPDSTVGSAVSKSASAKDKKVLCTPADETPDLTSPSGQKKDKKKDEKKDEKKDLKGKDDKGKGGKKKKEQEMELKRGPPSYTTLANFHIPLEEFLEGEYEFKTVFKKDGAELAAELSGSPKGVETDKKDGKKDKDKKNKPGSSKKDKGKDSRRASVAGKGKDGKDSKGAPKGKGGALVEEDIEEIPPPPPLEVEVKVRLHHWKTAIDSLKDEEEKNKNIEEQQI
ncbi:leucine-rich repeat-containing protein 43-like isoform X9 [Mytilus californianus]|uniref:leucine-rich repeat-containing protein 43-like isoform X9 n=1 Tax=Mytilus californianus TaxID=6549 RepID=UPI002245DE75|nr:leucine-rich repeat-containing protein 43-like isoform X9 [Mytilus californianus]